MSSSLNNTVCIACPFRSLHALACPLHWANKYAAESLTGVVTREMADRLAEASLSRPIGHFPCNYRGLQGWSSPALIDTIRYACNSGCVWSCYQLMASSVTVMSISGGTLHVFCVAQFTSSCNLNPVNRKLSHRSARYYYHILSIVYMFVHNPVDHVLLRARCTDLTKWLTVWLTIWLSVCALQEALTVG